MSDLGDWGPAPPGVDLTENQNRSVIGSVIANTVLAALAVGLRIYVRRSRYGPGLGYDDYFVLLAMLFCLGNAVCCLVIVPWGGGRHLWALTFEHFTKLFQTTYAFVIVYITCVSATKVSILLYYRRAFGTSIGYYVVFVLAVLHWFEVTATWLAGCRPISYYWTQYTDPTATGQCIDASLFFLVNGYIGLVVDVAILVVPIPTIHKLRMAARRKLLVCLILFLGSFVCAASAVRIVMVTQLTRAQDISWAMSHVFIWSHSEPSIGIICACLPTYAPLVRGWVSATRPNRRQSYFRETSSGEESFGKTHDGVPIVGTHMELPARSVSSGPTSTDNVSLKPNWETDIVVKREFSIGSSF